MEGRTDSLSDQVAALANGHTTPVALAERALDRAYAMSDLNAFVAIDTQIVMAQAEAADRRRRANSPLSPIDGIPIAVKDNYLTCDYPTTACSNATPLEPTDMDATVVRNLRDAGAVIFGKTNMHEWAYGATNSTSRFGPTKNPHNLDHITGGSSGGSGAAVAAGIVPAALGSDTGGSVRIPASACGIYGFKPSYGRASRHGILPLSWSLDAPGPMAAELEDLVHLLPFFLGPDPLDRATSSATGFKAQPEPGSVTFVNLSGPGLERATEVDAAVNQALGACGAHVRQASLPKVDQAFAAWETILHCEASAYHQALLRRHPGGFSAVTRAHLEAGAQLSAVELLNAQIIRGQLLHHVSNELGDWDALVLPTLPVSAPVHGEDWQDFGQRRVTTQDSMTWFCWIGNLTGLPCISLPIGTCNKGLPIGMMLMGRPGQDEALLAVAKQFDRALVSKG